MNCFPEWARLCNANDLVGRQRAETEGHESVMADGANHRNGHGSSRDGECSEL